MVRLYLISPHFLALVTFLWGYFCASVSPLIPWGQTKVRAKERAESGSHGQGRVLNCPLPGSELQFSLAATLTMLVYCTVDLHNRYRPNQVLYQNSKTSLFIKENKKRLIIFFFAFLRQCQFKLTEYFLKSKGI